jgi:hypothetical protein
VHKQKVLVKMFRPLKKYPSRDTVPLTSSKLEHNYLFLGDVFALQANMDRPVSVYR